MKRFEATVRVIWSSPTVEDAQVDLTTICRVVADYLNEFPEHETSIEHSGITLRYTEDVV